MGLQNWIWWMQTKLATVKRFGSAMIPKLIQNQMYDESDQGHALLHAPSCSLSAEYSQHAHFELSMLIYHARPRNAAWDTGQSWDYCILWTTVSLLHKLSWSYRNIWYNQEKTETAIILSFLSIYVPDLHHYVKAIVLKSFVFKIVELLKWVSVCVCVCVCVCILA